MPYCGKCDKSFPCRLWVDGKLRNLQNRKYCFDCSPFGSHNTQRLEIKKGVLGERPVCKVCAKRRAIHGTNCYVCNQKERELRVRQRVHKIVGDACWVCGYDKGEAGRKVLDFHHLVPAEKKFGLSIRNMCNLSWSRVYPEIQKCMLLCCRCHREYEVGLISDSEMEQIYTTRWKLIEGM